MRAAVTRVLALRTLGSDTESAFWTRTHRARCREGPRPHSLAVPQWVAVESRPRLLPCPGQQLLFVEPSKDHGWSFSQHHFGGRHSPGSSKLGEQMRGQPGRWQCCSLAPTLGQSFPTHWPGRDQSPQQQPPPPRFSICCSALDSTFFFWSCFPSCLASTCSHQLGLPLPTSLPPSLRT